MPIKSNFQHHIDTEYKGQYANSKILFKLEQTAKSINGQMAPNFENRMLKNKLQPIKSTKCIQELKIIENFYTNSKTTKNGQNIKIKENLKSNEKSITGVSSPSKNKNLLASTDFKESSPVHYDFKKSEVITASPKNSYCLKPQFDPNQSTLNILQKQS